METENPPRWRGLAAAGAATLALLLNPAAGTAGVPEGPATGTVTPRTTGCTVGAPAPAGARLASGSPARDPGGLTAAELRRRETELALRTAGEEIRAAAPVVIQTYVHVIRRDQTREGGNLPDSMINQQIEVLNQAYSGATGGAAAPFSFALAGVTRTTNTGWYDIRFGSTTERSLKSSLRQGGMSTLNIYLTGVLRDPRGYAGLLGWASFPEQGEAVLDGVVLVNETLPGGLNSPYDQGDTATHEVGHWLNLYHTFEAHDGTDGCQTPGDYVDDTPFEAEPAFGCPDQRDSCPQTGEDPVHNFMDYVDDACMYEFTQGQVDRMTTSWQAYRV